MSSPRFNQEIVRQRHRDLLRKAEKERLAHVARGGTSGSSALARVRHLATGLTENVREQMRQRAVREHVIDAGA